VHRLKQPFLRLSPEWVVAAGLALVAIALSFVIHAPIRFPSEGALLFIGSTYLFPFVLVSIWILLPLPFLNFRREYKRALGIILRQVNYTLCLGVILIFHFHIKLWAPLINPASYDHIYNVIDQKCFFWMDPLISWRGQFHYDWLDNLYFYVFVFMFFCSFIVHSLKSNNEFRRVFLASALVQAIGAVSYLIAPALGPFIYHHGVNDHVTDAQQAMFKTHQALLAGGVHWLKGNTGKYLAAGLAAMPSLHLAASFVFLWYALKYCRWLAWFYWPCVLWIIFEAMASRWHYGIDLVAGIILAYGSIFLANRWMDAHEAATAPESKGRR
jgi:membrane-associated phospholipid phosphatase